MNAPQPVPFTRQTHNTSYLAYERNPSKKPVPVKVGDGIENMRVHSDVFIREYTSIQVAEIQDARAANQRTPSLLITLDASSVQTESGKTMRENFGGSIQAGGELERVFRHAHANGIPLYVAIETKRKYKGRQSGEVISYLTPINELRGCTPDGKGTEKAPGMSREHCSNVIVAVGPADDPTKTFLSPEAVTDPTTWEGVRSNRDGTLPPTGFVRALNEAGDPTGAIIPRTDLPAATGATVDVDELAAAVAAKLIENTGSGNQQSGNTARPAVRATKSIEGKAWEPFNSDGRVNPGSYLLGEIRNTRSGAISLIENAVYSEQESAQMEGREPQLLTAEQVSTAATALVRPLMWAADVVQVHITGKVDRVARSHTEAGKWVHQIASRHIPYTLAMVGDSDESRAAAKAWLNAVVADAKETYEVAMTLVTEYCDAQYGQATPPNDASRAGQRAAQRQNPPQDPTPSAPANDAAVSEGSAAEPVQPTAPSEPAADADPAPAQQSAPAESSAPASSVQQDTPPPMVNDDQSLVTRWYRLLEVIKMGGHPDKLKPLLITMFNHSELRRIPAAAFENALSAWESNPGAFTQVAQQAYTQATNREKIPA